MLSIPAIKSCLGCRTRSYKDPETNSQITCKCSETSAGDAVAPLFYPLGQRIFMKKDIESKMKSNLQLCSYGVSSMEHCHEDLPSFFGLITSRLPFLCLCGGWSLGKEDLDGRSEKLAAKNTFQLFPRSSNFNIYLLLLNTLSYVFKRHISRKAKAEKIGLWSLTHSSTMDSQPADGDLLGDFSFLCGFLDFPTNVGLCADSITISGCSL